MRELKIRISGPFRDKLRRIAEEFEISVNQLVLDSLHKAVPLLWGDEIPQRWCVVPGKGRPRKKQTMRTRKKKVVTQKRSSPKKTTRKKRVKREDLVKTPKSLLQKFKSSVAEREKENTELLRWIDQTIPMSLSFLEAVGQIASADSEKSSSGFSPDLHYFLKFIYGRVGRYDTTKDRKGALGAIYSGLDAWAQKIPLGPEPSEEEPVKAEISRYCDHFYTEWWRRRTKISAPDTDETAGQALQKLYQERHYGEGM